ncbi:MAG: hypothetical protein A2V89_04605 [Gammaproteobacteria bacterium RBG_16_37_9]|nr:MAG: hypothetical protein A2V89_04605 [Gammaproteobacteria bacterium RBG_16_37_9]
MDEKNIFLAFDYGTTNTGVAVGQKITKSASTLTPLVSKNMIPPWEKIDDLIKAWKPHALVVGVPYQFDDSEFDVTKHAINFISQLEKRYKLPVYPAEERLTTKAARAEIYKRGGYRALQNESVDSDRNI